MKSHQTKGRTRFTFLSIAGFSLTFFIATLALLYGTGHAASQAAASKGSGQAPAGTGTPCADTPTWNVSDSPNLESTSNALYGVALSPGGAWAVGEQYEPAYSSYVPLAEWWNGTEWATLEVPNLGQLRGVTALAFNDAWAVGFTSGYASHGLTLHWDGSMWTAITNASTSRSKLYSVAAASASDIWAVGESNALPLTMHYDGANWSVIASPTISNSLLNSVAVVAPNDVWAVGTAMTNSQSLILHWNGSAWSRVTAPNIGSYQNVLTGITALGANDIWAVGYNANGLYSYDGLTLHWDGSAWSAVANGTEGGAANAYLQGVSASPNGTVWAVGRNAQSDGGTGAATLILRWDGSAWSTAPSPSPGFAFSGLNSVVATSESDAWAAGTFDTNSYGYREPLIERYYGAPCTTPTPVPPTPTITLTPTPPACNTGFNYTITKTTGATFEPATQDIGLTCSSNCTVNITLPFPFTLYDQTFTTAIVGSNGVLGFVDNQNPGTTTCLPSGQFNYAIVANWEQIVYRYGPDRPDEVTTTFTDTGVFTSVTGVAPDRIFNVEYRGKDHFNVSPINFEIRLYENSPTGRFDIVYAAVNHHGSHASVGVQRDTGSQFTQFSCLRSGQIERGVQLTFNQEPCNVGTPIPATSVPTGVAQTSTPPAATGTALPPTNTVIPEATNTAQTEATATTTACLIQYTDVPPWHTFYKYIGCLACKGIVSGYSDGTFRPNGLVTRGQLAKMVSNAAGFSDEPGAQMFEDVPAGSAFYSFVQRLASRGIFSGYPCGGPGEACGSQERPYFRPSANATRGQLSKLIVNTARLDPAGEGQMFQDVPQGSTFYDYVQATASGGIVGGYPCGSTGEPCGPDNLPYFRPSANATRGQTAKIITNTFFPGCGRE